mmetsp:Transcript_3418/g.6733  ORF Transcript_3418/g.6733 Transcript_3418/m.6733 type:complete len:84 (-) Transcript_3418:1293-1544(-)
MFLHKYTYMPPLVSSQAVSLNEGNNDIAVSKLPVKVGSLLASHEDGNESEMRAVSTNRDQAVFLSVFEQLALLTICFLYIVYI